ncbi:MAG: ABC transporter permease [Saprospiraceae bacterium]|nr:ABC transporter permease [Saprospiraceae bacterium]
MAAADQTGLARFGDLTPDFILLFILPLLIILMGYNTFTREKEGGTLKLVKSQGLSNWTLAVGKWWGIFLPVFLISTFLFAIGGVLLGTLSNFGSFEVTHLLLLFAVYLLFYAIFTNLTLVVSMLSKSSGIALVMLLTLWIIICLGAPKAASKRS